jgi:S-adenosylmethionine decarboxylase
MNHLGVHWTAELYGCDPALLDDVDRIGRSMLEAARVAGATIVSSSFHRFAPQGVSGVVVIAESHLAIHTWPELGYVALDVFSCGDALQAEAGFHWLAERFHATRVESRRHVRGDPRRVDLFRHPGERAPLHPELFRFDATFAERFLAPGEPRELAEQVYELPLFTPEFCRLLIEECEHRGAWVPTADTGLDPDAEVALPWEALASMEAVYRELIERHVRPVAERLFAPWRLAKAISPATHRCSAGQHAGLRRPPGVGVMLLGALDADFTGGGVSFPRWSLTWGQGESPRVGRVLLFPAGVSHAFVSARVTTGRRYLMVGGLS